MANCLKFASLILLFIHILSCQEKSSISSDSGKFCKVGLSEKEPECRSGKRPIVFVHGFMGGGDNFSNMIQRFLENGYCQKDLIIFDWNTSSSDVRSAIPKLTEKINKVLEERKEKSVDLVCHSLGGALCSLYLQENKDKVAHYVHAGSFRNVSFPAEISVMALWGGSDALIGQGEIKGAKNVVIEGGDHLEVVSSAEAFRYVFEFFNDGSTPEKIDIVEEENKYVYLSGKIISLAENEPITQVALYIYEVDKNTGFRLSENPVACFITDSEGRWGVFKAEKEKYYEFYFEYSGVKYHYYRQPFLRSNFTVYMRTLGRGEGFIGNIIKSQAKFSDNYSIVVLFSSNKAVYLGRDKVFIDDNPLPDESILPEQTTVAFFFRDIDEDGKTSFSRGAFSNLPLLEEIDYFIGTDLRRSVKLELNGKKLFVPNWKSKTEGISIAVFDY